MFLLQYPCLTQPLQVAVLFLHKLGFCLFDRRVTKNEGGAIFDWNCTTAFLYARLHFVKVCFVHNVLYSCYENSAFLSDTFSQTSFCYSDFICQKNCPQYAKPNTVSVCVKLSAKKVLFSHWLNSYFGPASLS